MRAMRVLRNLCDYNSNFKDELLKIDVSNEEFVKLTPPKTNFDVIPYVFGVQIPAVQVINKLYGGRRQDRIPNCFVTATSQDQYEIVQFDDTEEAHKDRKTVKRTVCKDPETVVKTLLSMLFKGHAAGDGARQG